jgi:hypothetical protein
MLEWYQAKLNASVDLFNSLIPEFSEMLYLICFVGETCEHTLCFHFIHFVRKRIKHMQLICSFLFKDLKGFINFGIW